MPASSLQARLPAGVATLTRTFSIATLSKLNSVSHLFIAATLKLISNSTKGEARLIMGGEVDCAKGNTPLVIAHALLNTVVECEGRYTGQTRSMMELKTSMIIRNDADEVKFERRASSTTICDCTFHLDAKPHLKEAVEILGSIISSWDRSTSPHACDVSALGCSDSEILSARKSSSASGLTTAYCNRHKHSTLCRSPVWFAARDNTPGIPVTPLTSLSAFSFFFAASFPIQ